jgi:hypothetical protein
MGPSPKMMSSRLRPTVAAIAAVRLCAGVALGGTPNPFLSWEQIPPGSSMTLLMRTVGIRDLALGLGSARAVRSGSTDELERWVSAGLLSDVLDVAAGLASTRTTRARGLVSALIASPMVVADLWALASLRETSRAQRGVGYESRPVCPPAQSN